MTTPIQQCADKSNAPSAPKKDNGSRSSYSSIWVVLGTRRCICIQYVHTLHQDMHVSCILVLVTPGMVTDSWAPRVLQNLRNTWKINVRQWTSRQFVDQCPLIEIIEHAMQRSKSKWSKEIWQQEQHWSTMWSSTTGDFNCVREPCKSNTLSHKQHKLDRSNKYAAKNK